MSFKVIEDSVNRKPVRDFLLVINSNWHPISYQYQSEPGHHNLYNERRPTRFHRVIAAPQSPVSSSRPIKAVFTRAARTFVFATSFN